MSEQNTEPDCSLFLEPYLVIAGRELSGLKNVCKGRLQKIKPVKLVTLSKRIGRGQDQITIFSPSKIVTFLTGGGVCSSNVIISFSTC